MKHLCMIFLASLLAACGGSDKSDVPALPDPGSASAPAPLTGNNEQQPSNSALPTPEQIARLVGVYSAENASGAPGDEIYYSIDEAGIIRTHDYMNDAVDAGGNCYQAAGNLKANYQLEGRQLYWDTRSGASRAILTYHGRILAFDTYSSGASISGFSWGGFSSRNLTLSIDTYNGEEVNLRLVLVASATNSPTANDIAAATCSAP